ncbi:thiamine pyrophosphate-binding protein [Rummeliibacillus suwonensis]|uniref:thiamine pyrophosphate-binding protein n=1 Tax=Rummeliibacillus suwonensis TaxID=1306154 RepID=UPI001AAFCA6E|nr:thiamine pyrophosphate-binding protein [Rummeliibacillus suwonensis]MBO2535959.1 thiamine pyrophosphate-binding protein [Rummeliibacillus suwonensis]
MITVNRAIAKALKIFDIDVVFGLPNDDLLLMKEIKNQNIDFVVTKDQRNAMFMTVGYALSKKSLGVCVVGKGPALTNCVTGLLEGHAQSVPVLILASGTSTPMYGEKKGFQETKQIEIVRSLTKWSHRLETSDSIDWVLHKAAFIALNGTPGIVYIEIPENLSTAFVDEKAFQISKIETPLFTPNIKYMLKMKKILEEAKKPVLIIGGGLKGSVNSQIIERFVEKLGCAVYVTASGRGAFYEKHPLFCGLMGLYSHPYMKEIIIESDFIMVLGSKLEETSIFGLEQTLQNKKNMIQVNINEDDFNLRFPSLKLLGDGESVMEELSVDMDNISNRDEWKEFIQVKKKMLFDFSEKKITENSLQIKDILKAIDRCIPENAIFVHENGLQDMWTYFYPHHVLKKDQNAFVPSEQTSLGFGVAAATGIAKAFPNNPVVVLAGDGAFNMFLSDLPTQLMQNIPIIYVIFNNGGYGWLEYQNHYKDEIGSFIDRNIRLDKLANEKLQFISIRKNEEIIQAFSKGLQYYFEGKTVILDFNVELSDVPKTLEKIYGNFPCIEEDFT